MNAEQSQQAVLRILDSVRDVPTLPAVAMRAVEISNDDDSSAKELGDFIAQDPALTTKLLTLVNAAQYGVSGKVATVSRAIVIMGFAKVRNIILSSATANIFTGTSDCLNRTRVWEHSVATATAARLLAKHAAGVDPETAYVAGLLHEVGIAILDRYFHEPLRIAILTGATQHLPIDQVLRATLGLDQFRVGAYLAQRWRLPLPLCSAIAMHNYPPANDRHSALIATVHVASLIADACKLTYDAHAAKKPIGSNAITLLQITPAKIQGLAEELNKQRRHIEEFAALCNSL